jgi:hypothetical protein
MKKRKKLQIDWMSPNRDGGVYFLFPGEINSLVSGISFLWSLFGGSIQERSGVQSLGLLFRGLSFPNVLAWSEIY